MCCYRSGNSAVAAATPTFSVFTFGKSARFQVPKKWHFGRRNKKTETVFPLQMTNAAKKVPTWEVKVLERKQKQF